jgi:hypothetical protein
MDAAGNIPGNKKEQPADLRCRMQTTAALIDMNIRWLRQAGKLLERLDDLVYAREPLGFAPHRAGAHLRHVLEFYECFLTGLDTLCVDYDARRRDTVLEHSRAAAAAAIRGIIRSLQTSVRHDSAILVRMEDAPSDGCLMVSSVNRELQVLSSHTIHHFALMALTLRLHGVEMDAEFGVAPSTLRHMASQAVEAATCAR